MKKINFVFMFVVILIALLINTINIKVYGDAGEREIILEVDVNNPMTLDEIIENAQIEAHSASIDYTNSIVCLYSDGYFANVLNQECISLRKLGDYNMFLEAENQSGRRSYLELTVRVVDKEAPEFITSYCKSKLTIKVAEIDNSMTNLKSYILKNVKAHDAHDVFDLNYSVDVTNVEKKEGNYNVIVEAKDKSGNASIYNIQIQVLDDKLANIIFADGHDYMIGSINDNITLNLITGYANPVAFDNNQNHLDISCNYNDNMVFNEVGMYEIIYSASYAGENLNAVFYLEIIDEDIEFTYDEKLLVVKKDDLYTYDDINNVIKMYANKNEYTYEVIEDGYSENYDKIGDYRYVVQIHYEDGTEEDLNLRFKVIDENEHLTKEDNLEIKKPNFFEKVWQFLKKMAIILYKIMKWPFTMLKW